MVESKWTIGFWPKMIVCLVILTLGLQSNAGQVFMGRYKGQLRRDFIFDQMLNIPQLASNPPEEQCPDDTKKTLTIDYFKQNLDHFGNGSGTWKQHYQVNNKYFDKKTSTPIIFLNIGGEGPISNKWVCYENYTYMQLAKEYKARVIQLEHRFFGSNIGLNDLSVKSLQYLTTEQALADLYYFIEGYNKQNNWTSPKWVAFGGSYPGTMAGLFRLLYPNATQGAIASSAVLYPKLDLFGKFKKINLKIFLEYSYVMEKDINETDNACYTATKRAFKQLEQSMLNDRETVKAELKLISDLTANKEDIDTVKFKIFDAFQGIIQYTYDARELKTQTGQNWTLTKLCEIMTNDSRKLIQRLSDVYELAHDDDPTFDPSYVNMIEPWQNTTIEGSDGMRGWLWLSCNQFGWLQSTTDSRLFGDAVPISYLIKICSDLFENQLTAMSINQKVTDTLNRYGYPWNYNGTNVVFPVGGYDPWSTLATNVTNNSTHVFSHVTPGAAHCSDMYANYTGEPKGLEETRSIVRREVKYYLSLPSTWGNFSSILMIPNALMFLCVAFLHLM